MKYIFNRKYAVQGLAGFLVICLLCAAGGFLWLRTSLPTLSGSMKVRGLSQTVTVIYDRNSVPHISASSVLDAYRTLGFVHARDRLFQMDFMRRLGAGRLSEVVGKPTVALDRTMRTLGVYRLAEESLRRMPEDARSELQAYADGVNAFLSSRAGALPPEFILLGYTPDIWKPADSLVWGRLMAMRLTGNWRTEALRASLAGKLTRKQINDLWPDHDRHVPTTVAQWAEPGEIRRLATSLSTGIPDWLHQVSASNSWALTGDQTKSGKPLLANDPHLGFRAPGLWYLARISAPGVTVTGATVPGVPFHILGHNGRIAWAFTTTGSDTQDLFIERLSPGRADHYETPTGPAPFETRRETIAVRGAAAVTIDIRNTRHGPVISDIYPDLRKGLKKRHVMALAATGLRPDDMSALGLRNLNRATDWGQFIDALEQFHSPQQNVSYADVDGNIGFLAPGRVPVRKSGTGGRPVPGWTGSHDWTGLIPYSELPRTYNPASGRIVNANHRIVPPDYRWHLADDWGAPYRTRRILQLLSETKRHAPSTAASIQNDILSLALLDIRRPLLDLLDMSSERHRDIARQLRVWDGRMSRDRAEPLILMTWLVEVSRRLYADELGPQFKQYGALRPQAIIRMLTQRQEWCDDVRTIVEESCRQIVGSTFATTLYLLESVYGTDPASWRWGTAHPAHFAHPLFGRIPVLNRIADIRIESDGGAYTVNRAQPRLSNPGRPFTNVHGPGYRAIYDLANLANSLFAVATGQSGNPLSPRYAQNTRAWRDGEYIKIPQTRKDAVENALGILKLVPLK